MAVIALADDAPPKGAVALADDQPLGLPRAGGDASFLGASARAMMPRFGAGVLEDAVAYAKHLSPLATLKGGEHLLTAGSVIAGLKPPAPFPDVTAPLARLSQQGNALADAQMADLSPEAQTVADKKYATLDPSKAAYLNPTRVTGDVIQNLPPLILSLVAPALRARSLVEAGGQAAVKAAASRFALESASSEATIGYGQEAVAARQRAAQAQSTDGTDLLSSEAAERAGAIGGATDAATELVGGKVLGHVLTEGGRFGARVLKGAANQGITEAVQGAGEQVGENFAIKSTVDPAVDLFADVPENIVSSGVVGAAMGGGVAGPLGRSGRETGLNPAVPTGDAGPQPQPTTAPPSAPPIGRGEQGDLFTVADLVDRGIKPEKDAQPQAEEDLKTLLAKYDGDKLLALTAYKAGPNNVDSWVQRFGYDPEKPQAFLDQITKVGSPEAAAFPKSVMEAMGAPLDGGGPVDEQGTQTVQSLDTLAHQGTIAALLRGSALDEAGNKLPFDKTIQTISAKLSSALKGADVGKARTVLEAEQRKIEKAANQLASDQTDLASGKAQHTPEEQDKYQSELDDRLEKLVVHATLVKTGHELVNHFEQAANVSQPDLFPQAAPAPAPVAAAAPAPSAPPITLVTEPATAPFGRRPTLPAEPQSSLAIPAAETELAAGLKAEAANTVSASEKARTAILDRILGDPETRDPMRRLVSQLKRAGLPADISAQEAERIGRYEAARDAFHDPTQPDHYREASAPDESDNFGIPERRPVEAVRSAPAAVPENAPVVQAAQAATSGNIQTRGEAKAETLGSSRRAWFLRGLDAALNGTDVVAPTSPSKASWFNEGKTFVADERAHQEREAATPPKKTRSDQLKEAVAKLKKPAERGSKTTFNTAVAEAEQKSEITPKDGVALRAAAEAAWDQGMWDALDTAKKEHSKGPAAKKFAIELTPSRSEDFSRFSPERLVQIKKDVYRWLRKELNGLGLHDVELIVDNIVGMHIAHGMKMAGAFSDADYNGVGPLIEVAYDINNPRKTLHHEAIHALRHLNVFTDKEWAALETYATKGSIWEWAQKAYPNDTTERQIEEAVAETYAQWNENSKTLPYAESVVRQLMRRMRAFFSALQSVFHRAGLTSAEQVMRMVQAGDVGMRERGPTRREIAPQNVRARALDASFPEPVQKANKAVTRTVAEAAKKGHIWLTFTEDLANMAKNFLPSASRLIELHSKNFALSRQFEERLLQIKEAYERLPASLKHTAKGSVNEFLYDSRMAGKWGFKPDYMPKAEIDQDLEQRFNRMPKPAQDVIQSVFRFNYDARNQLYKATVGAIDAEYDPLIAAANDPAKAAEVTAEKSRAMAHFSRVFDTREGVPYTPLKREGMWVVVGRSNEYAQAKRDNDQKTMDKLRIDPAHYFVDMRDTVAEAEAVRDNLATKFGKENTVAFERSGIPDGEIGGPELYIAFQKLKEAVEGEVGANPGSKAAKELHRLATDLYLHTLSDTSARKGELRADLVPARDPVTGEVVDMMRAFVTRGQATTHYVSSISNNSEMQEALRHMREELSQTEGDDRKPAARFYNELLYRYTENLGHRPNRFLDKAARAVSFYNLLTVPMYYVQNATQAVLLSQPLLAGHVGYDKAMGAFAKAYADFAEMTKDTSITDRVDFSKAPKDVVDILKRLAERGRLDAGLTHELGSWQMNGDGAVPKGWNAVDRFFRQVPQRVEVMNRVVTGIAAYRTMLAKTKDPEAAFQYASKLIYDSHGDYSGFNAPTPFHALGNWSKIVLQFRKFQMIMASMLVKEFHKSFKGETKEVRNAARVGLFFTAAHMAAVGGVVGMPAANALGWAIGMALSAIDKDRRDEYHDWEEDLRTWLGAGKQGDEKNMIADLLFKGAPYALLNADLSGKLGLGTVASPAPYSDVDKALDSRGAYYTAIGQLLSGALGGVGAKAVDGWSYAQVGDVGRAAELMVPGGIGAMLKAHRLSTQGVVSRTGDVMTKPDDISLMDEAMTAMGLTPRDLSDPAAARSVAFEAGQHYDLMTTKLKREYITGGDTKKAEVRDAWEQLQEARVRQGFKRQPMADLLKAGTGHVRREAQMRGGVETTPTNRRFVMDMMGELSEAPN